MFTITPLLLTNNSLKPLASTVLILKLTVTAFDIPSWLFGTTVPAWSGTNNSAPFSPTIDGCPTGGRPPFSKPFILSGGIGLEDISEIKKIIKTGLPIHAIDVNSKFEISPGNKNIELLKEFKLKLF